MNNIKSNTQNYKVELSEENQLLSRFESLIKEKINVENKLLKIKEDIVKVKEKIRKLNRNMGNKT